MPEIGTSGSMSENGKRSVAEWPKLPRPFSTLPNRSLAGTKSRSAAGYPLVSILNEIDLNQGSAAPFM